MVIRKPKFLSGLSGAGYLSTVQQGVVAGIAPAQLQEP